MKVVLTGASGFLGQYILPFLPENVLTLGRGHENDIQVDLSYDIPKLSDCDFLIHNAGLAHRVPKTKEEEDLFFKVNVKGTENLLLGIDALKSKPQSIVLISTVAVYGLDQGQLISEEQIPNPITPYGKSKLEAEKLLSDYANKNNIRLTILRLPLVAGSKNAPGNLGAMISAIKRGYYFRVKGLNSKKSMVLAEDVGRLIPTLFNNSGVFNLTDGIHPSLMDLESYIAEFHKRKIHSLPLQWVKLAGKIGDRISAFPINSYRLEKLTFSLTFDDRKARHELLWNPLPVIGNLDLENIER